MAIVQRHLGGPAGRVVQTQLAASGAAGDRPLVQAEPAMLGAAVGDLGATILQRYTGGPVRRAEDGQRLTVVPRPASALRQEAAGLERLSTSPVQSFPALAVRRDGTSVSSLGRSTVGPRTVGPRTRVASGRVEMPLARVAGGIQRAGGGGGPPVQTPLADSGTWATVVQRAVADTAAASEGGVPTGESGSLGEAPSGAEGPDLEHLADEVYAIIERRLIIERESRGL